MAAPVFRAPRFIHADELEGAAAGFLRRYHPSLACPVPIEEIVEFGIGIEIRPELFPRGLEISGFLSFDAKAIYVDAWQMEHQETRYRFTLAHEVGHWVLHRDLYAEAGVTDLETYISAYAAMEDDDQRKWEWQALNFAGRILLPKGPFLESARAAVDEVRAKLPKGSNDQLVSMALARSIAPRFNVHHKVAETRLLGDGLCADIGLAKPGVTF